MLDKDGTYKLELQAGMRGVVYIMQGDVDINSTSTHIDQAAFVEGETVLEFKANKSSKFMLCMGMPHGEPIHQHGPFVD